MFHRLPDRIRAHAQICFIALVLHRLMRMRLKAAEQAQLFTSLKLPKPTTKNI